MDILETLRKYLTAPPTIGSIGDFLWALLVLVLPWLLLIWVLAVFLRLTLPILRESLGAYSGAKVAWAWSALGASFVILSGIGVIWLLDRLPDWSSSTPLLFFELCGTAVAWLVWKSERRVLKQAQSQVLQSNRGVK